MLFRSYGEDVSLERHMLQTAAMAQARGAAREVVLAALLHDIGHLLHAAAGGAHDTENDFEHESLGAVWLSRAFDAAVTAPIALHVRAKRYLCAAEPEYLDGLSDASRRSLALQGGIMDDAEVRQFAAHPAFAGAILLRRCDDLGKDVAVATRPLADYRAMMTDLVRSP